MKSVTNKNIVNHISMLLGGKYQQNTYIEDYHSSVELNKQQLSNVLFRYIIYEDTHNPMIKEMIFTTQGNSYLLGRGRGLNKKAKV